jgi:hypothetical protein
MNQFNNNSSILKLLFYVNLSLTDNLTWKKI